VILGYLKAVERRLFPITFYLCAMKTITCLIILLCVPAKAIALRIQQLALSPISPQSINVSINTQAVELYYFQSWQYVVDDYAITIEASYISGFGSTIEYLNNNFQLPINADLAATYNLTVKIYYANQLNAYLQPEQQDEMQVVFQTPLRPITFLAQEEAIPKDEVILYPNPTDGNLLIIGSVDNLEVFDSQGRQVMKLMQLSDHIDLSALANGIYYIAIIRRQYSWIDRIVKR